MKKEDYIPQPIDTTDVKLPKELIELGEVIAKNVHEVWAAGRVKDGWTYGMVRDDVKKTHPCLIPYEELTETIHLAPMVGFQKKVFELVGFWL